MVLFEKIETLLIASIRLRDSRVALFSFLSGMTLLKSGKLSLIILVIVVVLFSVTSIWFSFKFIFMLLDELILFFKIEKNFPGIIIDASGLLFSIFLLNLTSLCPSVETAVIFFSFILK